MKRFFRTTLQRTARILLIAGLLLSMVPGTARAATTGSILVWGQDPNAQALVPAGLNNVIAIAAGYEHNLALKSDGTVVAWGANLDGQLNIPDGLSDVTAIATGGWHNLALKGDGTVVAWGNNANGKAVPPAGLNNVIAIAAGQQHSLALKDDGTVVSWGSNQYGQVNIPAGLSDVTAIAGAAYHSLALKSDGTVVAWGFNIYGQLDIPAGLSGVTAITVGAYHNLALKSDGTVVAWGYNLNGQTSIPAGLSDVTAIAAGFQHSLALKSDGTLVAWGSNHFGSATIPAGMSSVFAIAAGGYHNLALTGAAGPVDQTGPFIALTAPFDGAVYQLNQSVIAGYTCQDEAGGSGLLSCEGSVPSGSAVDTTSLGLKSFTVNAADIAGNLSSIIISYSVVYSFSGFSSPVDAPPTLNLARAGQVIPLKFHITDANGVAVTDLTSASVTIMSLECGAGATADELEEYTSGDSGLKNLGDGNYQFNWHTSKDYGNSCRTLNLYLGAGPGIASTALFQFNR